MKTKKFLFYLLAFSMGGCVPVMSLHPLYTEKDLVPEGILLGTWVEDSNEPDCVWDFQEFDEDDKAYKLVFTDNEGRKGLLDAHLTKIDDNLFLDLYPTEPPWDEEDPNIVIWAYNTVFMVPTHTFAKIELNETVLKIYLTDDDEMEKLLKEKPGAVKHTFVNNQPLLLDSTQKLREFFGKYAGDKRLFSSEYAMTCKRNE
jgi:hypothetical protein